MFQILVVLFLTPICFSDEFKCNKLHKFDTKNCILKYCKNQLNSSTQVDQINPQVQNMEMRGCKVDTFPNNLWITFPNLSLLEARSKYSFKKFDYYSKNTNKSEIFS